MEPYFFFYKEKKNIKSGIHELISKLEEVN